jgi:hypothetical protein
MKTSLAPIAVAALMLAACGSGTTSQTGTSSSPAPTTVSASPSTEPGATPTVASREDQIRDIYLDNILDEQPGLEDVPGEDLVTMGQGFCQMYDGGAVGADINEYILTAAGVAFTVHELVAVHGAAVGAFCPEHLDKMG